MGLFGYKKTWFWAQSWEKDFKTNPKKTNVWRFWRVALHIGMSLIVKRDIFQVGSDSDSDHMLQSQLGQRIYAICDMKHGMRALLQGGALASR